jgi:hypothetical protein
VDDKVDSSKRPEAAPNPEIERMPTPPPTGVEIRLPLDGQYVKQSSSKLCYNQLTESRRFECDVFAVHVGTNGHQLTAHETILSQSPYLRAKCLGGRQARQIHLPDDDVHYFRLVLEYLYSRTFNESVLGSGSELAKGLGKLYILACKYLMGSLTALIVLSLRDTGVFDTNPMFLLRVASGVYSHTPPADKAFKEFFVESLVNCHQNADKHFSKRKVRHYVERGGPLASDIHLAQQRWDEIIKEQHAINIDLVRKATRRDRGGRRRREAEVEVQGNSTSSGGTSEGSKKADGSAGGSSGSLSF